jgi:hypothetical protein
MITIERKIQQLAKEAGAYETTDDAGEPIIIFDLVELERFAGRVLEEAALKFDQPHKEYFGDDIQLTIRAMKPEVK